MKLMRSIYEIALCLIGGSGFLLVAKGINGEFSLVSCVLVTIGVIITMYAIFKMFSFDKKNEPQAPEPQMPEVQSLSLKSGDTLVIKYEHDISSANAKRISEFFSSKIPDGVNVMVLCGGADLQVLKNE